MQVLYDMYVHICIQLCTYMCASVLHASLGLEAEAKAGHEANLAQPHHTSRPNLEVSQGSMKGRESINSTLRA